MTSTSSPGPPSGDDAWAPWALLLPLLGAAALAGLLLLGGSRGALLLGFLVAYLVPPLSKETVLPLAVAAGFSPWEVGLSFTAADLLLAAFVAWNWSLLHRLPRLGPRLAALEARAQRKAAGWRLRDGPALALVGLFMAAPLQGSGAATATLLGRALALRPARVFAVVAAGAVVLNFGYAVGARFVLDHVGMPALVAGALGAALVGAALVAMRRKRVAQKDS